MAEWIYFLHPPRERFADTMTEEEGAVFREHFAHLQRLLADGVLVLAGPTIGPVNTGIAVFEAPDATEADEFGTRRASHPMRRASSSRPRTKRTERCCSTARTQ